MASESPAPLGPLTTPLHKLAQMLSECAAFQTRCGLTYPDAAAEAKLVNGSGGLKRIFYPALEVDAEGRYPLDKVPLAVISFGDDWELPLVAGGARNYTHAPRGALFLELIDACREYHSNLEAGTRDFANFVGRVLATGDEAEPGLFDLAALNDRLTINNISQIERPQLFDDLASEEAKGKRYWMAKFQIRYGVGN